MKQTSKFVPAAMLAAALFGSQPTLAAEDAVRIVSRANCMVPLADLTPTFLADHSWTVNESISWDPAFWAVWNTNLNLHWMMVASILAKWEFRNWEIGFEPVESVLHTSDESNDYVLGWRAWAGQVEDGDTRMPLISLSKPHKTVTGTHWQKYQGTSRVEKRISKAQNCNLKQW
jgi:hypothetical protein